MRDAVERLLVGNACAEGVHPYATVQAQRPAPELYFGCGIRPF